MPEHKDDFEKLRTTGLRKVCPRCHRMGTVYFNPILKLFTILWEGPPRGMHGGECDRDIALGIENLMNPNSGCGYDRSTKEKKR